MLKNISKIFPDCLISGSVKNQKDLNMAYKQYPNFSTTYIQTALYWEDSRKWYEDNWPKVYKYLDKNFLDKFQTGSEHRARVWEFYLRNKKSLS